MKEIVIRFLIGGSVVSAFALLGDLFKPKSFAGLFGAAPSIALATLGLTVAGDGKVFAAIEARSMVAGAAGFFVYASFASWMMMHHNAKAMVVTLGALPLWGAVSFGVWYFGLH
jgi:hypothetical protein